MLWGPLCWLPEDQVPKKQRQAGRAEVLRGNPMVVTGIEKEGVVLVVAVVEAMERVPERTGHRCYCRSLLGRLDFATTTD